MGNRIPFLAEDEGESCDTTEQPTQCDAGIQVTPPLSPPKEIEINNTENFMPESPTPEITPAPRSIVRPKSASRLRERPPSTSRPLSSGPRSRPRSVGPRRREPDVDPDWTFPRMSSMSRVARESLSATADQQSRLNREGRVTELNENTARQITMASRRMGRQSVQAGDLQQLKERHRRLTACLASMRVNQDRIDRQRAHERRVREERAAMMEARSGIKRHRAPDHEEHRKRLMTPPPRYVTTGPRPDPKNRTPATGMRVGSTRGHGPARPAQPRDDDTLTLTPGSMMANEPMTLPADEALAPDGPLGYEGGDDLMQELMEADRQWRSMVRVLNDRSNER